MRGLDYTHHVSGRTHGVWSTPTQSARASVVEPVRKLKLPMSSNHAAKLQEAELLAELALTTREDVSNTLLLLCLRN